MGIWMIRVSVFYFFIGVVMGMMIYALPIFAWVHPHWNLLGWVSLALGGIIYHMFPKAGASRLGKTHFWLHVTGIPVLSFGLLRVGLDQPAEPFAPIGGLLIIVGTLIFLINVFLNVNPNKE